MLRSTVRRAALTVSGITVAGATTVAAYANTDQGQGFKRQLYFWKGFVPIILDYYIHTANSSPLVRYDKWKTSLSSTLSEDEKETLHKNRKDEMLTKLHEKYAPIVLENMLALKGLYVKLGQVLSVTLLPVPNIYRDKFKTLQSDVPGHESFETSVVPVLLKEFNVSDLDEIFEWIEPIPVGAASIGQAHKAKLKIGDNKDETTEDEREVIVKVQYPDAKWQVPADIKAVGDFLNICVWAGVVDEHSARLSYDEFARQFLSELDYEHEQQNLSIIYESTLDPNAPYQKRGVIVPKVYPKYCTKSVITMEYLPGPKLEDEAKRQLALLGINVNGNIRQIVSDAAREASNVEDAETGELVRRVTRRFDGESTAYNDKDELPYDNNRENWKTYLSKKLGRFIGVDSIFWSIRFTQRVILWTQVTLVRIINSTPNLLTPAKWDDWAKGHEINTSEIERISMTKKWIDALFDVHGHQIFNLGRFNADPHPGNLLVIEDKNKTTSSLTKNVAKLGLIDFGQCKQLNNEEQVAISKLILAVANKQSNGHIANAFRELGIKTKNDSTDFLANFARLMFGEFQVEYLDHSWHAKLHKSDKVLYFPKELSMVYRTSLLLRGLAMSLQINCSVSDQWKHHAQQTLDRNIASDII